MKHVFRVSGLLALPVLFTLAGCGGGQNYELAPVKGKVTCQGKPVPGGTVMLTPIVDAKETEAPAPPASAVVDENGNFEFSTKGEPGAPIGKHRITFIMPEVEEGESSEGVDPEDVAEQKAEQELAQKLAKIPCRRPAVFEFTVAAGDNTLDLKLSGDRDED